jgi:hypothetical protein
LHYSANRCCGKCEIQPWWSRRVVVEFMTTVFQMKKQMQQSNECKCMKTSLLAWWDSSKIVNLTTFGWVWKQQPTSKEFTLYTSLLLLRENIIENNHLVAYCLFYSLFAICLLFGKVWVPWTIQSTKPGGWSCKTYLEI